MDHTTATAILSAVLFLTVQALIARYFVNSCYVRFGSRFAYFAFWLSFFGYQERGFSLEIKQRELPCWGMTEADLEIIAQYRDRYWLWFFVVTAAFLLAVPLVGQF